MRVAHVITRLVVGGAQENTIDTVLGLHRRPGIEVELLSGPTTGREGSLEARLHSNPQVLKILPDLIRPLHPWHDLIAFAKLTRHFRDYRPDIVHTHSGKAGVLGRLAARQANVPIIVHTIHGPSFGSFQNSAANFLFRRAERMAARSTTHFVAVAQAMIDQYVAAGIGDRSRFTRILSGFNTGSFMEARNDAALRRSLGIREDDIVIGKIARLFKLKGHHDLFAIAPSIANQIPRAKFLLIGDGPLRDHFEKRVRALGLSSRFIFAGLIPPDRVPAHVGIMDLVVHFSQREGLPRALPQALAAARPVVAVDIDGASEVCKDGETGFLVRPGDREGLASRVVQLALDDSLRERLGRAGQAMVARQFAVETMVAEIERLYRRLLPETRTAP